VCVAACLGEQVQASLHPMSAKIGTGFIAFKLLSLELIVTISLSDILVRFLVEMKELFGMVWKRERSQKANEDKLGQRHTY